MIYRIRVAAIVLQEQKILLVKHVHPKTGFEWWVPPGGGLEELDKNIHDCAIRETREETGYNIETNEILYIREFVDLENCTHNLEIYLKGDVLSGDLSIKNIQGNGPYEHYIKEVCWLDKRQVKELIVFPEIIKQDEFWADTNQKRFTEYLGRQDG